MKNKKIKKAGTQSVTDTPSVTDNQSVTGAQAKNDEFKELPRLGRQGILDVCAPIKGEWVPVKGWNAAVKMRNISFPEFFEIQKQHATDPVARRAHTVAAICEDLAVEDVITLMSGNAFAFGALWAAVEQRFDDAVSEGVIKNLPTASQKTP